LADCCENSDVANRAVHARAPVTRSEVIVTQIVVGVVEVIAIAALPLL